MVIFYIFHLLLIKFFNGGGLPAMFLIKNVLYRLHIIATFFIVDNVDIKMVYMWGYCFIID